MHNNPEWPSEERIDIIGANGPTGEHYELERFDKLEWFHEQALEDIRTQRREYINRHNLNKVDANKD